MLDVLDRGFIHTQIWFSNLKEDFKSDERGVSGFVASVLLVLIAVLLATVFWDNIKTFVEKLFKTVGDTSLPTNN